MKNLFKSTMIVALAMISLQSCKDDEESNPDNPAVIAPVTVDKADAKKVMENYIELMYNGYKDSHTEAEKLDDAIKAFTTSPTQATQDAAKDAWLAAREVYGQTEVFRGSNGPIDTEVVAINNEGEINAWPLNEAFIDYVHVKNDYTGTYDKSIIEDISRPITEALLRGSNEQGGATGDGADDINAKAVSIGWHAIEFLLWGQDNTAPTDKKAGQRSYTDYIVSTGTPNNFERRKTYLETVSTMLVADLKRLVDVTKAGGTFRTKFLAMNETEALGNIISGPVFLASAELSQERMGTPANSDHGIAGGKGQEDEHSCFSDNTHRDIFMNAKGIVNVLTGKYGNVSGDSFMSVLKAKKPEQAKKLAASIATMEAAIKAIDDKAKAGTPFDLMILNEGTDNPAEVLKGYNTLIDLGNIIKESSKMLSLIAKDDNA